MLIGYDPEIAVVHGKWMYLDYIISVIDVYKAEVDMTCTL